jgi:transcriptional regulator with XRE-family HTH domain
VDGFANRLTNLRENRGLQKKQLADILNVSISCISQYEKGTSMPGYDILLAMARYFNVTVDYMLGNEDSSKRFQLGEEFLSGVTYQSLLNHCSQVPEKDRELIVKLIDTLRGTDL